LSQQTWKKRRDIKLKKYQIKIKFVNTTQNSNDKHDQMAAGQNKIETAAVSNYKDSYSFGIAINK
jgi:hypothetical protein